MRSHLFHRAPTRRLRSTTIALRAFALLLLLPLGSMARVDGEDAIRFESQVRPVLSRACLNCHGASEPEAGLDLTAPHAETLDLLAPGEPEISELLRRVASDDPDERMPPKGPPLTDDEIATLRRWIAEGADWPAHWAERPLVEPPPFAPIRTTSAAPDSILPTGPIDAAIDRPLAARGIEPVEPASRRTLARRLSFDLHGLPPEPESIDMFEADRRPDAVVRHVDRLLASPAYGERQARHWMDLVHYAETHGHDQDRPREHAWPYRDWLIRRFNEDVPYAQFVVEQVAGDQLPTDDPWATVGTGLLAAGPWDESSLRDIREDAPDREVARYLDRDDIVTTVMSTFIASSVHCARCHDHKFDPITQRDHYALQAIFASTDKGEREIDLDPELGRRRRDLNDRLAAWRDFDPRSGVPYPETIDENALTRFETALADEASRWRNLDSIAAISLGGADVQARDDGSFVFGGPRPDKDTYRLDYRGDARAVTGVRIEVLDDDALPQRGPGRNDNGNLHLTELRLQVRDAGAATWTELPIRSIAADWDQSGWTAAHAIDGNPNTAWGIFPEVGKPHQLVATLGESIDLNGRELRVELLQAHGGFHLIGRVRVAVTDLAEPQVEAAATLPVEVRFALAAPGESRSETDRRIITRWWQVARLERELAALPPRDRLYCGSNRFAPDGSFRPAVTPRPVFVLRRGLADEPIEPAVPGAIASLDETVPFELAVERIDDEGARRAALARWLVDPRHPLTWRTMANRIWLQHFGRGIVATPNDFGRMGAAPTHPELLDWLAIRLRDDDSMKLLHRRIVTSAAYGRSSRGTAAGRAADAQGQWLWRYPIRRLDAESFRDALLSVSGALDRRMGGPSVREFVQRPGIHVTPIVDYAAMPIEDPAHRRRAVYRFVFRTIPDPLLDALDCPDASQLTPQRNESLTAVQALATLNGRQTAIAAERLAERLTREANDDALRVDRALRLLFGRGANDDERQAIAAFAQRYGWTETCRVLLNANEFLFVD